MSYSLLAGKNGYYQYGICFNATFFAGYAAYEYVCFGSCCGRRIVICLDIGVIAGALPFITDHFVLTSRLQEWVVSSMMLGAAIGALFNGWLSFRPVVIQPDGGAILFVLGSIGSALRPA